MVAHFTSVEGRSKHHLTVGVGYAPHSGLLDSAREEFFESLHDLERVTPARHFLVMLLDANATLPVGTAGSRFALADTTANDNTPLFSAFLRDSGMVAVNCHFQRPSNRTWSLFVALTAVRPVWTTWWYGSPGAPRSWTPECLTRRRCALTTGWCARPFGSGSTSPRAAPQWSALTGLLYVRSREILRTGRTPSTSGTGADGSTCRPWTPGRTSTSWTVVPPTQPFLRALRPVPRCWRPGTCRSCPAAAPRPALPPGPQGLGRPAPPQA
eukprot:jgi/Mesvir1/13446/Mv25629-RA.1